MEYIKSARKDDACIFCKAAAGTNDKESLLLYRGKLGFVMMNKYPYANGHLMVAPYAHTADIGGLDPAIGADLF